MIYLDTGCLAKLYYPEPDSASVVALVANQAIAYLGIHELELTNAFQLKAFRKEVRPAQVRAAAALLDEDVRTGVLHRASIDWDAALRDATEISRAHSARLGCRSLDILHCAAARALRVTKFVSTDVRQRRLATALGLTCPAV